MVGMERDVNLAIRNIAACRSTGLHKRLKTEMVATELMSMA